MKLPITETPENRQIAELLEHCIGPERVAFNRLGRYTIMVVPFRQVAYDAERDQAGIVTPGGYVGIIDHQTGRLGASSFDQTKAGSFLDLDTGLPYPSSRKESFYGNFSYSVVDNVAPSSAYHMDIETVAEMVRQGNLDEIIKATPMLFNLNEKDELTNVYIIEKKQLASGEQALSEASMDWLHAYIKDYQPDAIPPEEVQHYASSNQRSRSGVLTLPVMAESTMGIRMRRFQEDAGATISFRDGESGQGTFLPGPSLGTSVMTLSIEAGNGPEYHQRVSQVRAHIKDQSSLTCLEATARFLESYRKGVIDQKIEQGTQLSREELIRHFDEITRRNCYGSEELFLYIAGSGEAMRNKAQLLSRFNEPLAARSLLLNDDFRKAIEEGRSLRDALSPFPLLTTSKRSINNFLDNLDASKSLSHEHDATIQMEKGPVALPAIRGLDSMRKAHTDVVALVTTLPESSFQKEGEERCSDHMWEILTATPKLVECLKERVNQVKAGTATMKNALTWAKPYVEDPENHYPHLLADAGRMLKETYYTPISRHIALTSPSYTKEKIGIKDKTMNADAFLEKLAASGEYRDLIRASEIGHKIIHETYKRSKPDHSLAWKPCIDDYSEGGVTISAVTSNDELSEEGRELNHCVGSYLRSVIRNDSYILSIKIDGKRTSTIEIQGESLEELAIVQHQGFDNRRPSSKESRVGEKLLEDIKMGWVRFEFEPCKGIDSALDRLSPVERTEVFDGIAYSQQKVIMGLVDDFQKIAPTIDIWDTLKSHEHSHNHEAVDALRDAYLEQKKKARSDDMVMQA